MCHIKAIKRGEENVDGGQKIQPSLLRDRPTRFKIDSTDNDVASEREQSQKNAFCSLIGEECPSSALFICQRNVLHLIPNHCSLCFTMQSFVRGMKARPEGRRGRNAIKWFSRPSTSGWQSDKISNSPPSPPACPELQYHVK